MISFVVRDGMHRKSYDVQNNTGPEVVVYSL